MFTPQVVLNLKRWLADRLLAEPASGIPYLTDAERTDLAAANGLSVRQIMQWFQNRRKDFAAAQRSRTDYAALLLDQIRAGTA